MMEIFCENSNQTLSLMFAVNLQHSCLTKSQIRLWTLLKKGTRTDLYLEYFAKFSEQIEIVQILVSMRLSESFSRFFNPIIPNAPFFYSLKISENRMAFWCFQGVEKGFILNKWVKVLNLCDTNWFLELFCCGAETVS